MRKKSVIDWFLGAPEQPKAVEKEETTMSSPFTITVKGSKNLPRIVSDYQDGAGQLATAEEVAAYATSDLVYACVDYIATTASQAIIRIHEIDSKSGDKVPVKDKKLLELFAKNPNPYFTWSDFIDISIKCKLLAGNSYMSLEKVGSTLEMWNLLSPYDVSIVPDSKNYVKQYSYKDEVFYTTDEVCHWKSNVVDNEYYGMSAIRPLLDQLLLEGYGTEDLKAFYENSSVGSGVFSSTFPLTPKQTEDFKKQVRALYGQDSGGRHSSMVLPNGMSYSSIMLSPQESMLLDSLNISEHRVLQTFHVNPLVLGGKLESYTTKPREVQQMVFNSAVRPQLYSLAEKLSQFFSRVYKKDLVISFDFDRIPELSDSMSDKATNAKTLWSTGIASMNEARDLVGLPRLDVDNANKHFLPSYLLGSEAMTVEDWVAGNGGNQNTGGDPAGSTDPQGGNPDLVSE